MAVSLRERLGALSERDFRLLFTATTITTVGDRLAGIALAFAVLDFGSATDLGIVLGVRQGAEALVLLAGGVLSDRLPRQLVLTGASLVQGAAQAATAAVILAGTDSLSTVVALQALYGVGGGLVIPAEVGLVPQTVSPARLQQANALQGLSRNVVGVLGPAVGGAIVVAGSPGVALGIDAASASFVVCAAFLARIRVPRRRAAGRPGFFGELREGWAEFTSRTWLWMSAYLRACQRLLHVLARPRACGCEGTARWCYGVGDHPLRGRRRRSGRWPPCVAVSALATPARLLPGAPADRPSVRHARTARPCRGDRRRILRRPGRSRSTWRSGSRFSSARSPNTRSPGSARTTHSARSCCSPWGRSSPVPLQR